MQIGIAVLNPCHTLYTKNMERPDFWPIPYCYRSAPLTQIINFMTWMLKLARLGSIVIYPNWYSIKNNYKGPNTPVKASWIFIEQTLFIEESQQ